MKMTKIRLIGLSTIDLPVVDALTSDRYILKESDGLGPPEVDVSIAPTLNSGGVYQGRRPQGRQIVLQIALNPDFAIGQTAADLRSSLYGTLSAPGDKVRVEIMDGTVIQAFTEGYVSKMEINPFSKDPAVQVTIECLQPYLSGRFPRYVDAGSTVRPFIVNVGTAPTGFVMELILQQAWKDWTLTNGLGKRMHFQYLFAVNDRFTIDTRPGSRGIWVTRNGQRLNAISSLSADSEWLELHGGENAFQPSWSNFTWGDVYYVPQYWGI